MGHSHLSSKSNVVRTHLIAPVGSSNSNSKGWKSIQSHNYSFERDKNDKCNIISSQQEECSKRQKDADNQVWMHSPKPRYTA